MSRLKAFQVQNPYTNTGGIEFAKTNAQARSAGARSYADGDFFSVECSRAQWADEYADRGFVPTQAMVDHGWRYECWHCGQELPDYDADFDAIVGNGESAFCDDLCLYEYRRNRAIDKAAGESALAEMKAWAERRIPGVIWRPGARHYARSGRAICVTAPFTFPGAKHGGGVVRVDDGSETPSVLVSNGDRPDFESWLKTALETK